MTEEEANKKWCPFFAVSGCIGPSDDLGVVTNRPDDFQAAFCIGSKCMAWRADDSAYAETRNTFKPGEAYIMTSAVAERYANLTREGWVWDERLRLWGRGKAGHGYCGLAGKP